MIKFPVNFFFDTLIKTKTNAFSVNSLFNFISENEHVPDILQCVHHQSKKGIREVYFININTCNMIT